MFAAYLYGQPHLVLAIVELMHQAELVLVLLLVLLVALMHLLYLELVFAVLLIPGLQLALVLVQPDVAEVVFVVQSVFVAVADLILELTVLEPVLLVFEH